MTKETSAADAVKCIESGSILAVDGFVGSVCPEELLIALEQRFLDTGEPRDLTVWASTGSGDTRGKGLDRLHHDGIIKRLVVSYLNLNRKLQKRLVDNKIEGFLLPLGVMVQLYREIAAGRPG
ncbi:MAG: CoA-transferase, partial [Alphaproteobacteria bacterium]